MCSTIFFKKAFVSKKKKKKLESSIFTFKCPGHRLDVTCYGHPIVFCVETMTRVNNCGPRETSVFEIQLFRDISLLNPL